MYFLTPLPRRKGLFQHSPWPVIKVNCVSKMWWKITCMNLSHFPPTQPSNVCITKSMIVLCGTISIMTWCQQETLSIRELHLFLVVVSHSVVSDIWLGVILTVRSFVMILSIFIMEVFCISLHDLCHDTSKLSHTHCFQTGTIIYLTWFNLYFTYNFKELRNTKGPRKCFGISNKWELRNVSNHVLYK